MTANHREGWSRESCLEALERAVDRFGEDVTIEQYESLSAVPSADSLRRGFGSFNDAKRELGIEPEYTEEDCFQAIRTVADELGHAPTLTEYIEAAEGRDIPSQPWLYRFIDSFPDAREQALEDTEYNEQ